MTFLQTWPDCFKAGEPESSSLVVLNNAFEVEKKGFGTERSYLVGEPSKTGPSQAKQIIGGLVTLRRGFKWVGTHVALLS